MFNKELVPDGESILDPADQRFGIQVKYNKDTRQFTFISGTTGEDSNIKVGRALLHNLPIQEEHFFSELANNRSFSDLQAGDQVSVEIDGKEMMTSGILKSNNKKLLVNKKSQLMFSL